MSDEIDDLDDAILEAAANPKQVTSASGVTVQAQSLADMQDVRDRQAARSALSGGKSAWGACRPAYVIPPGATGPNNTT